MNRKNKFWIYTLLIGIFLVLKTSCTKVEDNPTNGRTTALFNPNLAYGSMTDQDGNVYKTITIGSQTWMAEHLRTTRYRNGEPIPLVTDNAVWPNLSTVAYGNYNNTKSIV